MALSTPAASSSSTKGIAFMVAGGVVLTVNDAVLKWLTADYPVGEIIFLRGAFAFVPIALFIWRSGGMAVMRIRSLRAQGIRAGAAACSAFLFVAALGLMPLADAVAISFAGPLFITALAPSFLGEKVGWRRWSAVVVGFAGILVMTRPGGDTLHWVALVPLGAAFAGSFRDLITRRITTTESTPAIMWFTTLAVTLGGLVTAPFGWRMPAPADLGLCAISGCLLGAAHYLLIEAFRFAEAALVAPFRYITIIWAAVLGFLVWGDLPDHWMIIGSALVVGSCLYILHRERRR
jgi:drug/metabolite transporter (DMT)-like permease